MWKRTRPEVTNRESWGVAWPWAVLPKSTGKPFWQRAWLFPGAMSLVSEGKSFCGLVLLTCPYKTPANPTARHGLGPTNLEHVLLH